MTMVQIDVSRRPLHHQNSWLRAIFQMSTRPFRGVAYEPLPSENVDVGFEDSLNGDVILRMAVSGDFADRQHVERRLLRKLDMRMSFLVLMWTINYIDRLSVSAARLHGFEEDLHLEGQQFNTVLSVFYIGYTLMQVPSNMYLDKIGRPSLYFPTCMALWGLILGFMGTANGFAGAVWGHFLLGFVEAAFFSGALLTLSKWYKRREIGERTAILSCGGLVSSAFGPLLASAILDSMDGVLGQAGWRWLFYIEGFLTVFVAICATFILPDFPATSSSWLTVEEQALAQLRMTEDIGGSSGEETKDFNDGESGLKQAFSDWKVWWLMLAMGSMKVLMSFGSFFPTLTATLGYSPTISLLLCVPPWLVATLGAYLLSRHSDAAGERFWHTTVSLLVAILGFLMAMATMNTTVRYLSLFLMAQSGAAPMVFFAWVSNSISHPSKRAVTLAFVNAFSSLGNVAGSYVWQKSWGPLYWDSCVISIGTGVLCIMMSWVFRRHLMELNRVIEAKTEAGQSKGVTYLL